MMHRNSILVSEFCLSGVLVGCVKHVARDDTSRDDDLASAILEAEAAYPECRDYNGLLSLRETGSNGWSDLARAIAIGTEYVSGQSPLAKLLRHIDDVAPWPEPLLSAEFASAAIVQTEDVAATVARALRHNCLVAPVGDPPGMINSMSLIRLRQLLEARIRLLIELRRDSDAHAELVQFLSLTQRLDIAHGTAQWSIQQTLQVHAVQVAVELFPRLAGSVIQAQELWSALQPSRYGLRDANLAELAWLLHTGREANSEREEFAGAIRAAVARLQALEHSDDPRIPQTRQRLAETATSGFLGVSVDGMRYWTALALLEDASALSLRLRLLEAQGLLGESSAREEAQSYPALKMSWRDGRIEFFDAAGNADLETPIYVMYRQP